MTISSRQLENRKREEEEEEEPFKKLRKRAFLVKMRTFRYSDGLESETKKKEQPRERSCDVSYEMRDVGKLILLGKDITGWH